MTAVITAITGSVYLTTVKLNVTQNGPKPIISVPMTRIIFGQITVQTENQKNTHTQKASSQILPAKYARQCRRA